MSDADGSVPELLQALKTHNEPARSNGAIFNAMILRLCAGELTTISYPRSLPVSGFPSTGLHESGFARLGIEEESTGS
jgi:hypothetical protein